MKVQLLHLFLFLIIYPIYSFGQKNIIEIDMRQYETINFNNLVNDLSCIKLESENVPSFDSCTKMILYNDNLYLLVRTIAGSKVVIYKKSGEFVKEITFSDALLISSLIIVPEQKQLWVVSRFKVLNKFKLDGTLIKREALPFPCVDLIPVDKENFLIYDGGGSKNIQNHFMALTNFKVIHKLFLDSKNKKKRPFFVQNMYAPDSNLGDIFIFPDCTDTIYYYNLNKKEIKAYYHLDFHGDFLTRELYPVGGFSDKEMSDIITKRKYIYSQYSFYQANGRLFFKLAGKRNEFCTINLKNNSLCIFYYLFDNYQPTTYNPFIGSDGRNLYCIIKEKEIVEHYKKTNCTYPAIKKLLPSLSIDGNSWIILSVKIKNNL